MERKNTIINDKLDVFRSYLVRDADYAGKLEMPVLHTSRMLPKKILIFSKALRSHEYDSWVAFYEHDYYFNRIWLHPKKYLPILKGQL